MGSRFRGGRKPKPGRDSDAPTPGRTLIIRGDMAVLFVRRAKRMVRALGTPTAASETTYARSPRSRLGSPVGSRARMMIAST